MKILLFGKDGQVGSELASRLPALGGIYAPNIDITNSPELISRIQNFQPDVIINAAAYTFVDRAEHQKELCWQTNAVAPEIMARVAKDLNAILIHYSTDYVFDGTGDTPWSETDPPSPLNIYGESKLQGDAAIMQSGCRHFIFRSSWIYGLNGHNFVKTILRLAREKESLSVVTDQVGSPTSAIFLADATTRIIPQVIHSPTLDGLYHVCCEGQTSWFDYSRFILDICGMDTNCQIQPTISENFKQDARRPLNSRLNTKKFQSTFSIHPPVWQDEIRRDIHHILRELEEC